VQFDGSISDHAGYCVIGGASEDLTQYLRTEYRPNLPLGEALSLGKTALGRVAEGEPSLDIKNLEVCVLERDRVGRKFVRLNSDRIEELLGS
jgi:proteasome alpha subunit